MRHRSHAGRGARFLAVHRSLRAARGGNVTLIVALLLPLLLVTSLGAVELNQVLSDKKRTQDVADSAALMGAGQLGVTPVGADQRAQAFAQTQLNDVARNATVTVQATVGQGDLMTVAIDTQRASFFGNLLPPGGFHTHVTSSAKGVNTAPLCVLAIAPSTSDTLHLTGTSQLQAGQCLVHSNEAMIADAGASILASANEAGTTAQGPITQTANQGAPPILDPFATLSINPASCVGTAAPVNVAAGASQTLPAGVHLGAVTVSGGSTLTLGPGDHYFCRTLTVSGNSTMTGTDVDLVFDTNAVMSLSGANTAVNLSGRQSGPLAGFVIIADRNYANTFTLQSDFITGLTGTIYVPTATLAVQGTSKSGASSPWTVITARSLTINGGAQLVINANYAASSVPVPNGVGDRRSGSGTQLTQ